MWRALSSQLIDEIGGMLVLYRFMRFRGHAPVKGTTSEEFPGLFSGDPEELFCPHPETVVLDDFREPVDESDECVVEDITFPSHLSSRWPAGNLIRCRRWFSPRHSQNRTVICTDGIVQLGYGTFRPLIRRLVPQGIDVLAFDSPFNHRRTPDGFRPGQLIVCGDMDHQLAVARQAVIDLWTVIQSVQHSGHRVGLFGISYGGWLSLMLSLRVVDLEFVMAIAPPVDMANFLEEGGSVARGIRYGLGRTPLDPQRMKDIARPLTIRNWEPRLSADRIHLHAARYDRFVPTWRIAELAEMWNTQFTMHPTGHIQITTAGKYTDHVARDILELWGQ